MTKESLPQKSKIIVRTLPRKTDGVLSKERHTAENRRLAVLSQTKDHCSAEKYFKTENSLVGRLKNKAGYTATLVACGWAGAVFELLKHLGKCSEAKDRKNIKKIKWGPTDGPTDGRTKRGLES